MCNIFGLKLLRDVCMKQQQKAYIRSGRISIKHNTAYQGFHGLGYDGFA